NNSESFGGEDKVLDWYQKLRKKLEAQLADRRGSDSNLDAGSAKIVDALIWLPDFFHLGAKLLFDGRVRTNTQGALVGALAYVISPIDLIPDTIPIAGWVDDLVVMAMGLNSFLDTEEKSVSEAVQRHWVGEGNAIEKIKHVLEIADEAATFIPKRLMSVLKGMFPKSAGKSS
ncbi:MAG: YkvA family protein, partial [Planctomycetota bacterium]|nr:YkvA family protein [Planctomycetota bacterium]